MLGVTIFLSSERDGFIADTFLLGLLLYGDVSVLMLPFAGDSSLTLTCFTFLGDPPLTLRISSSIAAIRLQHSLLCLCATTLLYSS